MHETRDGRLLAGAQASGKTVDALDAALAPAVAKLFAPLKATQVAPPPAAPPTAAPERGNAAVDNTGLAAFVQFAGLRFGDSEERVREL